MVQAFIPSIIRSPPGVTIFGRFLRVAGDVGWAYEGMGSPYVKASTCPSNQTIQFFSHEICECPGDRRPVMSHLGREVIVRGLPTTETCMIVHAKIWRGQPHASPRSRQPSGSEQAH